MLDSMFNRDYRKPLPIQKNLNKKLLENGIRLDGRKFDELRKIKITPSFTVRGKVEVCFGSTRVLSIVSEEINKKNDDYANEGYINFHIDFSPMSSFDYDIYPGQNTKTFEKVSNLNYIIESLLKKSRATNTESLYNEKTSSCSSFLVSIKILDDDGNVTDAACLSALAALLHYRRKKEHPPRENNMDHGDYTPARLCIPHVPIMLSLHFVSNNSKYIIDPTREESFASEGEINIAFNEFNELCGLHKFGGQALQPEELNRSLKDIIKITNKIRNYLKSKIEFDDFTVKDRQENNFSQRNEANRLNKSVIIEVSDEVIQHQISQSRNYTESVKNNKRNERSISFIKNRICTTNSNSTIIEDIINQNVPISAEKCVVNSELCQDSEKKCVEANNVIFPSMNVDDNINPDVISKKNKIKMTPSNNLMNTNENEINDFSEAVSKKKGRKRI